MLKILGHLLYCRFSGVLAVIVMFLLTFFFHMKHICNKRTLNTLYLDQLVYWQSVQGLHCTLKESLVYTYFISNTTMLWGMDTPGSFSDILYKGDTC